MDHLLDQLVAVAYGALTAAFTARLAVEGLGAKWALAAGAAVALLPSQPSGRP